jgi:hypothetical protein
MVTGMKDHLAVVVKRSPRIAGLFEGLCKVLGLCSLVHVVTVW